MSVADGPTPHLQWKDTQLQGRASATGNVDSPNTAQLRLTIVKDRVMCPSDFKMYMCRMLGISSSGSERVTQETSPIIISYIGMYYLLILFNNNYCYLFMYLYTKCNCSL